MAAFNIPLITWCVIVTAMTVLISVRLFKSEHRRMQPRRQGNLMETVGEREKFLVHGNILPKHNKR